MSIRRKLYQLGKLSLVSWFLLPTLTAKGYVGYVAELKGSGSLQDDLSQPRPLQENALVSIGDRLVTQKGSFLLLRLVDGSLLKLYPDTSLRIQFLSNTTKTGLPLAQPKEDSNNTSIQDQTDLIHSIQTGINRRFQHGFLLNYGLIIALISPRTVHTELQAGIYTLSGVHGGCFGANVNRSSDEYRFKTADLPLTIKEGLTERTLKPHHSFIRLEKAFSFTSRILSPLNVRLKVSYDHPKSGFLSFSIRLQNIMDSLYQEQTLELTLLAYPLAYPLAYSNKILALDEKGYLYLDGNLSKYQPSQVESSLLCLDAQNPKLAFEYGTGVLRIHLD